MRKLKRPALPSRQEKYLARKQLAVDAGKDAPTTWEASRKTKTIKVVNAILASMMGMRERCMFCEDSRGTSIDHFWPITVYKAKAFVWSNLLLVCDGCNRKKGNRFNLDASGQPLLIDPTNEDPWDYVYFDSHTGILTAKYLGGVPHPKGVYTTHPNVLPLNIQAITNGRMRTVRDLRRAVLRYFQQRESESESAAGSELLDAIRDNDDYGLAEWYFLKSGVEEAPFRDLKGLNAKIWQAIVELLSG